MRVHTYTRTWEKQRRKGNNINNVTLHIKFKNYGFKHKYNMYTYNMYAYKDM